MQRWTPEQYARLLLQINLLELRSAGVEDDGAVLFRRQPVGKDVVGGRHSGAIMSIRRFLLLVLITGLLAVIGFGVLLIRPRPPRENSAEVAARAVEWIRQGRYDDGIAALRYAIELNPEDGGFQYRLLETELPLEAIQHGETQVGQMLSNRPSMREHVQEADLLWRWAARKFAGEDLGEPVYWDASPLTGTEAKCVPPANGFPACIYLSPVYTTGPRQGEAMGFEDLWRNAVFEFHNVANAQQFIRLDEQAAAGSLTKEEYIRETFAIEHRTSQRTRGFYAYVFLPWAKQKRLTTDPSLWYTGGWRSADESIRFFVEGSAYPWKVYGYQYDLNRVHYLYEHGMFAEALELAEGLVVYEPAACNRAGLWWLMASCALKMGSYDRAKDALNEVVRCDPEGIGQRAEELLKLLENRAERSERAHTLAWPDALLTPEEARRLDRGAAPFTSGAIMQPQP